MNNNVTADENKQKQKMMYGALPHYVTAGFLGWIIGIFIRAFDKQDDINGMLQVGLVTYAFYLFAYVIKLIYSHCEKNDLGLLGGRSRIAGAAVVFAVYTLLKVLVKI